MNEEWVADSMHWHGRVLTGKFRHYCEEWDGLPLDDSCIEITCCICFDDSEFLTRKAQLIEQFYEQHDESTGAY